MSITSLPLKELMQEDRVIEGESRYRMIEIQKEGAFGGE
jgi:hypothetical protein